MDAQNTIHIKNYLCKDGTLKIVGWATDLGIKDNQQLLSIDMEKLQVPMAHSNATGKGLISNGLLGADVIHLSSGDGFVPHTHPGDHLLIVLGGKGTITYDGKIYPTQAGQIYMIEGKIPHAVGAITDHAILAIGSPHKPVNSDERMTPVEYQTVTAEIDRLHCLICDTIASFPEYLHDLGCPHCPCFDCNPY